MPGAPLGVDAFRTLSDDWVINTDLYDRSAPVQMTGNYYGLDPAGR